MSHIKNLQEPFDDVLKKNPFNLQILSACSALAIIWTIQSALVMSLVLMLVTAFSSLIVSLLRKHIPDSSRIFCHLSIISCLVIVVEQILRAIAFDIAQDLSIFIGLIITNCLVISRADSFAMKKPPVQSFFDGISYSVGYGFILVFVGAVRELFGSGKLLGFEIFPLVTSGGWYQTNTFFILPASAMFILAILIWIVRTLDTSQVEEREFTISANTKNSKHKH